MNNTCIRFIHRKTSEMKRKRGYETKRTGKYIYVYKKLTKFVTCLPLPFDIIGNVPRDT